MRTKTTGDASRCCMTSTTKNIPRRRSIPSSAAGSWSNAATRSGSATPSSSHADYSNVPRRTKLEHALFACDELAGFITACALVKPNKSLAEVEAKSVRKKMKDKAFARAVSRDDIVHGAEELGVELEEHIAFCIEAMKGIAGELGLAGTAAAQD